MIQTQPSELKSKYIVFKKVFAVLKFQYFEKATKIDEISKF